MSGQEMEVLKRYAVWQNFIGNADNYSYNKADEEQLLRLTCMDCGACKGCRGCSSGPHEFL